MEVDVAVIGGGPAGSTLAALLARRGVSVALIDRDTFPRDKVCGEFLSYDALPILESIGVATELDRLGAAKISRCRVVSDGRTFQFDLPATCRGISRFAFDQLLFERAVALGAQRFDGWSADLPAADGATGRNGDGATQRFAQSPSRPVAQSLVLRRGDETLHLTAKVIVGAWGRWGRMDRALDRRFIRDRAHRFFGFKRHYRGDSEDGVIELYSFRRGYLGVSLVEDRITNICGLVHHSRLSGLKGGWLRFAADLTAETRSLRRLFDSNQPIDEDFLSSEPVIFVPKTPVENGIFMIGDAAGLIDPLTGSGMAIALQSALVAAPAILAAISDSGSAQNGYRRKFHQFFGRRLRWSRFIAGLLSRPALLRTILTARPSASAGVFLARKTRVEERSLDRALRDWFAV